MGVFSQEVSPEITENRDPWNTVQWTLTSMSAIQLPSVSNLAFLQSGGLDAILQHCEVLMTCCNCTAYIWLSSSSGEVCRHQQVPKLRHKI